MAERNFRGDPTKRAVVRVLRDVASKSHEGTPAIWAQKETIDALTTLAAKQDVASGTISGGKAKRAPSKHYKTVIDALGEETNENVLLYLRREMNASAIKEQKQRLNSVRLGVSAAVSAMVLAVPIVVENAVTPLDGLVMTSMGLAAGITSNLLPDTRSRRRELENQNFPEITVFKGIIE